MIFNKCTTTRHLIYQISTNFRVLHCFFSQSP
nr:MAG TPA: hypothetical protein [Caudoviricetes sp.]